MALFVFSRVLYVTMSVRQTQQSASLCGASVTGELGCGAGKAPLPLSKDCPGRARPCLSSGCCLAGRRLSLDFIPRQPPHLRHSPSCPGDCRVPCLLPCGGPWAAPSSPASLLNPTPTDGILSALRGRECRYSSPAVTVIFPSLSEASPALAHFFF